MAAERWTFDVGRSSIAFSVRHLMVAKVHGRFTRWGGWADLDEQDPTRSGVDVWIDVTSLDTKDPVRDAQGVSDLFDVERFPRITFKSTAVTPVARGHDRRFEVKGDLCMRGVTRSVALDVTSVGRVKLQEKGERAAFAIRTSVRRKDFGVTFNQVVEAGGIALADKVEIRIEVEATRGE